MTKTDIAALEARVAELETTVRRMNGLPPITEGPQYPSPEWARMVNFPEDPALWPVEFGYSKTPEAKP